MPDTADIKPTPRHMAPAPSPAEPERPALNPLRVAIVLLQSAITAVALEVLTLWGGPASSPLVPGDWVKRRVLLFFVLVLFAALTSAIALTECVVSTFSDQFGWSRTFGTAVTGVIMLVLGTLSCLGYGPLSFITLIGMPFLDFFDFLTNSVMMPVSALAICLLVTRYMGISKVEEEVLLNGQPFVLRKVFRFMIRFVCPVFVMIILVSSLANVFGLIQM